MNEIQKQENKKVRGLIHMWNTG